MRRIILLLWAQGLCATCTLSEEAAKCCLLFTLGWQRVCHYVFAFEIYLMPSAITEAEGDMKSRISTLLRFTTTTVAVCRVLGVIGLCANCDKFCCEDRTCVCEFDSIQGSTSSSLDHHL